MQLLFKDKRLSNTYAKTMKKLYLLTLAIFLLNSYSFSQTPTVTYQSPTQLVQDVLVGTGVQISNAKFNNDPNYSGNQIGKFSYSGSQISFPSGIVMGSGGVANPAGSANGFIGTNNNGGYSFASNPLDPLSDDANLQSLFPNSNGNVNFNDIGVLEFDFVPDGNTVSFDFIFGSEEYNEYVCSPFFDAFGFFVTGPKPGGGSYAGDNLALVPGTSTPITINTINNGSAGNNGSASTGDCATGGLTHSAYFAGAPGNDFQMDGATKPINIQFGVICGQTYHFKFAIADVGDHAYDSWVLLKAGSFQSQAVDVSVTTVTGTNTIIRGCSDAQFVFSRPEDQSDTILPISYTVSGSAVQGTDYDPLPPVQFAVGEDSVSLTVHPLINPNAPDSDSIVIQVKMVNQCGDTVTSEATLYLVNSPVINTSVTSPTVDCSMTSTPLSATATGGTPPLSYSWNTGQTGATISVNLGPNTPNEYYVYVTDGCGFKDTDTVAINSLYNLQIDTLISTPSQGCNPSGTVSAQVIGANSSAVYSWYQLTPPNNDSINISSSLNANGLGGGWYYFSVKENMCYDMDSVYVNADGVPVAVIVPDKTEGCDPTTFVLQNQSTGGAVQYYWNTGNGYIPTNNMDPRTLTLSNTQTVYLIAKIGSCSDTASVTLTVYPVPQAIITPDTTQGCSPVTFVLQNNSVGGTEFSWDTGSGYQQVANQDAQTVVLNQSQEVFLIASNGHCMDTTSVNLSVTTTPTAVITPDQLTGCNPTNFSFANGSSNATEYRWDLGSGYYTVNSTSAQDTLLTGDSTTTSPTSFNVYLIAVNGACMDTATAQVSVHNCGCTDPVAINYFENATTDDGSCKYHAPEIVLPNVFTPNGDNSNDSYTFIKQNYIRDIEYWIFNRWGEVMFHTTKLNDYWNGKEKNQAASVGVYFIKYVATALDGKKVNGQAFFHLER